MSYGGRCEAEPLTLGGSGLAPTDAQPWWLSYEASLSHQSTPSVLPEAAWRSSHSLISRTRCRPANAILSSCSWIRSSKPSDVFIRCAVNLPMFCSRSCVRLQRGSAFGSGGKGEVFESLIQPLQAGRRRRGATGGQRRP